MQARGTRRAVILASLVLLLLLLSALPQLPSTPGAPSSTSSRGSVATRPSSAVPSGAVPPPLYPVITANCTGYWGINGVQWSKVGPNGLDPVDPNVVGTQNPCPVGYGVGHDAVHATFSSNAPYSGERAKFPLHLPTQSSAGIQTLFDDFFVGAVVTGNPNSVWGQSYLQVFFRPVTTPGGLNYSVTISVFSLLANASGNKVPGPPAPPSNYCPPFYANLTLSWNSTFSCEVEEVNYSGDQLGAQLRAGDFVNVTLNGIPKSNAGMQVWVNDSTESRAIRAVLNKTNTMTYAFSPAWSVACPDSCGLNWTFSTVGLGVGFDLCDMGAGSGCDSFDNSTMNASLPVVFYAPHFWNGSAYTGEYTYFSPQSDSGACSQITAYAIPCLTDMELGTYPYFTFNGSALNFGSTWPWTTYTWGGARFEFSSLASSQDFIPLLLLRPSNDSRAGFIGPGSPLNVQISAQDLGTLTQVRLIYTLPDNSVGNVSMTEISGTSSSGLFNATIPATGGNGKITYRIYAANHAGASLLVPAPRQPAMSVKRGPFPLFSVALSVTYSGCGGIHVNGTTWPDGTVVNLTPGTYPVIGVACYKYIWTGWKTTGGVSVTSNAQFTSISVSANGTLLLIIQYNRPFDHVQLASSPGCGQIWFNGTPFSVTSPIIVNGVLDNLTYGLDWAGCAGYAFSGWLLSDPTLLVVNGSSVGVYGNGTITATYIPTGSAIPLTFLVNPGQSGNILFRGAGYQNLTTVNVLSGTSYPLHQDPYGGWGFSNWTIFGSATIGAGQIVLTGAATITANEYRLTLVRVVTGPTNCGSLVIGANAYTNGEAANVTSGGVYAVTAIPCAGHYLIGMGVDPLTNCTLSGTGSSRNIAVYGSCTITASFGVGTPSYFLGIITNPIWCGAVVVAGRSFVNSNSTFLPPNVNVSLSAVSCPKYGFVQWQTTGGIVVLNSTSASTMVSAAGPGSLEALFHPLAELLLFTQPTNCGTITVDYVTHTNGDLLNLPIDSWRQLSARPCSGYHFVGWMTQAGVTISGGKLFLASASAITAVFALNHYAVQLLLSPSNCGTVLLSNARYGNGTTLSLLAGSYPIAGAPCPGFLANGFATSGSVAVKGPDLVVSGAGSVTALYGPTPPAIALALPSSTYTNSLVSMTATVAVPLSPPTGYKYKWSFGDGTTLVTPVNFTSHSFSATGSFPVSVTVTDPYNHTASDNATIRVSAPHTTSFNVAWTTYLGLGAAGVALVLAVLFALARRRRRESGAFAAPKAQEPPRLPPEAPNPALPLPQENENQHADELER